MILAVDIGNTNISVGGFKGEELIFAARIATELCKSDQQYACELANIFGLNQISHEPRGGAAICSVVPSLTDVLADAVQLLGYGPVVKVGPGVKTGLNIKRDNPAGTGCDMVCSAVGALAAYALPCIIIDMGTATTISALDRTGTLAGASILPGVRISLDALRGHAALLPDVEIEPPSQLIGKNTADSMKSGIVYGAASMLDGMVARFEHELGGPCTAVATGGLAGRIVPYCKRDILLDETLTLQGLYRIFLKNKGHRE